MKTIRLTAAQAMMRWLAVQMTPEGDRFIEGVWAIFGHGNGEHARLWGVSRRELPNMIVIAHPESWVAPLE